MPTTLGGIDIPDGTTKEGKLIWVDEFQYAPVDQVVRRTVGGRLHVRSHAQDGGRPITLEAKEDRCWITTALRDSLQGLANVSGQEYDLVWESTTYRVIFSHHDGPALDLKPLFPDSPYYVGQIKLMEVAT